MWQGVAYRCILTCRYTDTCSPSIQKHMLFLFFPPLKKQHRCLGGISWVEYFRRAVLFWRPAVRTQRSFYFKENALLFFSLISPFDSFTPVHLRGSVSCFYQWPLEKKQMTVQTEKEEHIKHLMTDFCSFFVLFREAHTWQKDKDYTLCLKATDFHTIHWNVTRRATEPKQIRKMEPFIITFLSQCWIWGQCPSVTGDFCYFHLVLLH